MINQVLLSPLSLQKLYIVCDVALFVIANKSTACHLDSPKEPVLPSKFFLLQDKAIHTLLHLTICSSLLFDERRHRIIDSCLCALTTMAFFPSKFYQQDFKNDKEYLSTEMRQLLLTGKVNKKILSEVLPKLLLV